MTPGSNPESTRSQRWLARLSFVLAGAAIVILALFAGLKGLAILAVALAAAVVSLVAAFFFLSRRGILRWLSLVVFALAPIAVIVYYAFRNVLWVAIASAAAWLLASMTARLALAGHPLDARMPEHPAEPPAQHPYVIMNPKSGGGKVERFDLKRKAEDLGAEVFLIGGPEPVDVAKVARDAVARGADLLSVAGGDGTQALVAGVAAEHGIPFVVISAGTRNHFALDLGLDREDPAACLGALSDGVELRVDLGMINGQVFVNNASFGAYAEIVQTPAYRGDKLKTTLNLLPDLLQGQGGARLIAQSDDAEIRSPQALLVANNPYGTGDVAGLSRRARLDGGLLGVIGVKVRNARQAADLLRGKKATGVKVLTTTKIEISADAVQIPVGIDGESVSMSTPVTCTISPSALRVWVPRDRPGVPAPKPAVNWARLRSLAAFRRDRAEVTT
jgi:diacylglycerol kinase family enzyme